MPLKRVELLSRIGNARARIVVALGVISSLVTIVVFITGRSSMAELVAPVPSTAPSSAPVPVSPSRREEIVPAKTLAETHSESTPPVPRNVLDTVSPTASAVGTSASTPSPPATRPPPSTVRRGFVVLRGGSLNGAAMGFAFARGSQVPDGSGDLVFESWSNAPTVSAADGNGIRDMGPREWSDLNACPRSGGYVGTLPLRLGHVYCIRLGGTVSFAKLTAVEYISDYSGEGFSIRYAWQRSGAPTF